ncbi:MAG: SDR family oxidoreductase, partial [Spirochaetaceae bacterium]
SADEFRGRVAVVTGGTAGLGRHLCATLIELGAEVFFCGRGDASGGECVKAWGPRARFVRCDLVDADQTRSFVQTAGEHSGAIDFLVNNAAIDPPMPFAESDDAHFDRVVSINLRSFFVAARAALDYLRAGTGKAIVNIGTTNYMLGLAGYTIYNSAKSGIVGFTRSLARDLGTDRIRVNMVSPGWIMTERQLAEKVCDEDKRDLLRDQALKYLLDESHVTPATLFLLSRAAAGITGQNLVVDAGKVMQ